MDKNESSIVSAIALNSVFGYEPKYSHCIIDALGSPEAVFALSPSERADFFGPYSKLRERVSLASLDKAYEEYRKLSSQGYRFVSISSQDYPEVLRDCPDAPVLLYIRGGGEIKALLHGRTFISIVGTRDISLYGKECCERIVHSLSLAEEKPCIVSGLALGVDICAHMTALACGLETIAVSPVGVDDIYPRRHSVAADKICSRSGSAIITDFPPGTAPVAHNFLRRNRIIAGMSAATVLVESKLKGGGAMTARLASGYGRRVFCVPGRIDDIRSAACNALIAEQIAEAVASPDSLPSALGLGRCKVTHAPSLEDRIRTGLAGADEERLQQAVCLCRHIRDSRGISLDELCRLSGLGYARTSELATRLESAGIISMDLLQNCRIMQAK